MIHSMGRVTLKNYRCFKQKQTASLAPLTLLVGNNSTGKTSFLALIRALWDTVSLPGVPDFQRAPYNLGVFRDIAHNRGGRGGQANEFEAGFEDTEGNSFHITFVERNANPSPARVSLAREDVRFEAQRQGEGKQLITFATSCSEVLKKIIADEPFSWDENNRNYLSATVSMWTYELKSDEKIKELTVENSNGFPNKEAFDKLNKLEGDIFAYFGREPQSPFASAPIRSQPRRTYDPIRPLRDPEGEYVPTYLASLSLRDNKEWAHLKDVLEAFGRESGLFDEINIKLLGKTEGSPFQVEIRKFGRRLKGPKRNLIDVGYGVSQALPLLTELLRRDTPRMFLIQQPEVHLHPSAQAALGSLFCNIAGQERQLIVETHSDYILDRVRMDIRDKKTDLRPEDVSILFFEPGELDVTIHSLRLDETGNVLDAPDGYRDFFMAETRRSIGF